MTEFNLLLLKDRKLLKIDACQNMSGNWTPDAVLQSSIAPHSN